MKRGQFNKTYPTHFDFGASLRKARGESSFARVFRQYKNNARRRSISFELSIEEVRLLTSGNCHYCGVIPMQVMQMKDANGPYIYNGIDRMNRSIGYTSMNCVSCCKTCNSAKSDMSMEDWNSWLSRIVAFRGDRHAVLLITANAA